MIRPLNFTDRVVPLTPWAVLGFLVVYVVLGRLGMFFAQLPPGNLTLIWLPSGLAVAGVMIWGRAILPWVFLASGFANAPPLLAGAGPEAWFQGWGHVGFCALIDVLQPLLAWSVGMLFFQDSPFRDGKRFLLFAFSVAFAPCLMTSWLLVGSLALGGYIEVAGVAEFVRRALAVVAADSLGILIVLPLIGGLQDLGRNLPRRLRDMGGLLALLMVLAWAASFWVDWLRFLILPLFLVMAFRCGLAGTAIGMLVLSLFITTATVHGHGPFSVALLGESTAHVTLMTFLFSTGLVSHFTAITFQQLEEHRELLEKRVAERTRSLENALQEIRTLRGIVPICSTCNKIRDDAGAWHKMETYVSARTEAQFSHGFCPDCAARAVSLLEQVRQAPPA